MAECQCDLIIALLLELLRRNQSFHPTERPTVTGQILRPECFMRENVVKEYADGYDLIHGDAGDKPHKLGFCERFVLFKTDTELHTLCKNELGNEVAVIGGLAEPFNAEIISLVVHGLLIIKLFEMDKLAQSEYPEPSLCKTV